MEIKIEEAVERIEALEQNMEWAAHNIESLRKWEDTMEKVYPIMEIDGVLPQSTYNKLSAYAIQNKISINEAITTLIEKADGKKEN